jgi:acetamidase/formamidase
MTVTLRFGVRKDRPIKELQFQTPSWPRKTDARGHYVTTAHGPDLMENAKNAVRYMIDWLVDTQKVNRSQAYILCSEAADLRISEIVDAPNWIVSAYMPLSVFEQ